MALRFVAFAPMLELVLSAAVESFLAFAALEEGLFVADLAAWGGIQGYNFISHVLNL